MTTYLTTTISPLMMSNLGDHMVIEEMTEELFIQLKFKDLTMAVGHENTAGIISQRFGFGDCFARVNLSLVTGDRVIAICPQFRAGEAREFTTEELTALPFRFFVAEVRRSERGCTCGSGKSESCG